MTDTRRRQELSRAACVATATAAAAADNDFISDGHVRVCVNEIHQSIFD